MGIQRPEERANLVRAYRAPTSGAHDFRVSLPPLRLVCDPETTQLDAARASKESLACSGNGSPNLKHTRAPVQTSGAHPMPLDLIVPNAAAMIPQLQDEMSNIASQKLQG